MNARQENAGGETGHKPTTDHNEIRVWVESRDGHPARIRGTESDIPGEEGGILRIDFGEPDPELERLNWEEFFEIFDERRLQFLCEHELPDGKQSRFFKFIHN